MQNTKSSGSGGGGIPVEAYKFSPNVVLKSLTVILNKCLKTQEIPFEFIWMEEWRTAYISSSHKNGNIHYCTNYQELSVVASRNRQYGSVLRDRIGSQFKDWEE